MFTVRVIPVARGVFRDSLTFFSKTPVAAGSLVSASVRGRAISGIVIESRDVRDEKLDLRSADFTLKKLGKAEPRRIFSPAFINAAKETALFAGIHHGAALSALTSQTIIHSFTKLEKAPLIESLAAVKPDFLIFQAERGERIRTYRNLARESFARGASVLILAPTVIEAETLAREVERGIETQVVRMTGEIPKKKLIELWNRAITEPKPLLVVGTGFTLSIPRRFETFVVERESARGYRALTRPYLDMRRAAESLAKETGTRLIVADFPLRAESRYRAENGGEEFARIQMRASGSTETLIIDARKTDGARGEKRIFTTLTEKTKKIIGEELSRGGRVVVFAARRGLAPLTVCNDCGTPVTDVETGTPMVLHKTVEGNVFISHRSGAELPAESSCRNCGGWNLVTLGIGIERVVEELAKSFPKAPLFVLTTDTARSHPEAKKIAERFFTTTGSILAGTERMLPYLTEPVELAIVASVDSLLSSSAWRAHEHTLSILFYLRERAENKLIVETRKPDHAVMKAIAEGNPVDFYRKEIAEREQFGYPPFTVFVGLSWRGTKAAVEKLRLTIQEIFSGYDLVGPLPAESIGKGHFLARAVIRLPKKDWPNEELAERLRALPPAVEVIIDPDEIV
ncbi:MAG TPA: hypothetical protein VI957_01045 [Candidatus Paceibacterota bacterium]